MIHQGQFREEHGILIPSLPPDHRNEEYDEKGFEILLQMQREHFWYRGRHKLLLDLLKKELDRHLPEKDGLDAIDLGGGCGGWIEYLHTCSPGTFRTLALGDSSLCALALADPVVGAFADRYQIDLLDLPWEAKWDVVFLLDVLEHIPDHEEALRQVRKSLRPGGLLLVATPALGFFWSYNDELAQHQRRYNKEDFRVLAGRVDLQLLSTHYFMFLLSPLLLLNRFLFRPGKNASQEELRTHQEHTHRIPPRMINRFLTRIFSLEASIVNRLNLPWGTSIVSVFRR